MSTVIAPWREPLPWRPAALDLPAALLQEVAAAYATPGRAYHTIDHVHEVLERCAEVARDLGWRNPTEVFLAVLFHDAVYDPRRKDNEARSADLARAAIARHLHAVDIDTPLVTRLIEATAHHGRLAENDVDPEAALFLDCDMAIVGASSDRFRAYDAGVANEYAHVPRLLYWYMRRRFLLGLLRKERIFLSDYFHRRLDPQARRNLAGARWWVSLLRRPVP